MQGDKLLILKGMGLEDILGSKYLFFTILTVKLSIYFSHLSNQIITSHMQNHNVQIKTFFSPIFTKKIFILENKKSKYPLKAHGRPLRQNSENRNMRKIFRIQMSGR